MFCDVTDIRTDEHRLLLTIGPLGWFGENFYQAFEQSWEKNKHRDINPLGRFSESVQDMSEKCIKPVPDMP